MLVADAVDLLDLTGAQAFGRIEAPDSLHQPLPPQHFVAAGDAAVEIVGDVEERAVAIGDAGIERPEIRRSRGLAPRRATHLELTDRGRGRYRPVGQRPAADITAGRDAVVARLERQRE